MRKRLSQPAVILLILLCAAWANASPAEEMFRPTPMPDRIVLTWSGDPSTSQAVTWRTDTSVTKAVAQITADLGPELEDKAQTVNASTSELETKRWKAHCHSAVFSGLEPDTRYAYRVGDGSNWSEWFHLRTASAKPAAFSFLYFGDVQNGIRSHTSRVIREAFRHAPDAAFLTFAGDIVNTGTDDLLWGEFFGAGGWLYSTVPILPCLGNHEQADKKLPAHWRAQFTLPENGIEGQKEASYYVDYQGARIIVLNCVRMVDEQAAWLEGVLAKNPNRWTIAVFHFPMFSLRGDRDDNAELGKHWKPLFEKYGVDLALTGHDHVYGRSGLIGGTVYVSSVAGSKQRDLERRPWMVRSGEEMQLFQVIRIDGDKLAYESRTAAGKLFDAFELRKQAGKPNRLTDRIPK